MSETRLTKEIHRSMSETRLTKEILEQLRRPFPLEAIKFKGQSANRERTKALAVPYIDSRLVIERLNAVVAGDWSDEFEVTQTGMWCHLTVCGVTRSDFGTVGKGSQDETRSKGLVSDARKRAGVTFGIGVSVYASPSTWLAAGGDDPGVKLVIVGQADNSKVKGIYLTDKGDELARQRYRDWLENVGIAEFGEPLGHGAVIDAAGLESDEQGEEGSGEAPAAPPMPLVTFEADQLRQTARSIYDEIRGLKGGRTKLPPARFQERLAEASTSIDALTEYARELRALVDELKGQG